MSHTFVTKASHRASKLRRFLRDDFLDQYVSWRVWFWRATLQTTNSYQWSWFFRLICDAFPQKSLHTEFVLNHLTESDGVRRFSVTIIFIQIDARSNLNLSSKSCDTTWHSEPRFFTPLIFCPKGLLCRGGSRKSCVSVSVRVSVRTIFDPVSELETEDTSAISLKRGTKKGPKWDILVPSPRSISV